PAVAVGLDATYAKTLAASGWPACPSALMDLSAALNPSASASACACCRTDGCSAAIASFEPSNGGATGCCSAGGAPTPGFGAPTPAIPPPAGSKPSANCIGC